MRTRLLSVTLCLLALPCFATSALADSPSWQPARDAFRLMEEGRKPAVFWFHGDGMFHNSLSHKFHQKEVVQLLRRFVCVQVPKPGGRSPDEEPIAKRFGIGQTIGTIVVCHWDGQEITRYGDVVETRHFVPEVKGWYGAHVRRLKETNKAGRALERAIKMIAAGKLEIGVLKVTQVLAKEGKIGRAVMARAREVQRGLVAQAEQALGEASQLLASGDTAAGQARVEAIKRDFGRLGDIGQRAAAMLGGDPPAPQPGGASPTVTFRYRAGVGRSVSLAGSFNGWSKTQHPMRDPDGDGVFETTLPLSAGRHQYKFVVDGHSWVHDPENPRREPDGHGGQNSLVER